MTEFSYITHADEKGIVFEWSNCIYSCNYADFIKLLEHNIIPIDEKTIFYQDDLLILHNGSDAILYLQDSIKTKQQTDKIHNMLNFVFDTVEGYCDGTIYVYGGKNVKDLSETFGSITGFDFIDLGFSEITDVTDYSFAFSESDFIGVVMPQSSMKTVKDMNSAFMNCYNLEAIKFYDLDLTSCEDISDIFSSCENFCAVYLYNQEDNTYKRTFNRKGIVNIPFKTSDCLKRMNYIITNNMIRHFKIGGEDFDISGVKAFDADRLNDDEIVDFYVNSREDLDKVVSACNKISKDMLVWYIKKFNLDLYYVKTNFANSLGANVIEETALLMDIYGDDYDYQISKCIEQMGNNM